MEGWTRGKGEGKERTIGARGVNELPVVEAAPGTVPAHARLGEEDT